MAGTNQVFSSIGVNVGADMSGLKNGLSSGLDEIENFADDAKDEILDATKGISQSATNSVSAMTNAFSDAAESIVDNSGRAAGELKRLGGSARGLSGPLQSLGDSASGSIQHIGKIADVAGFAADGMFGLKQGAEVLGQTFPKVGRILTSTMSTIWKAITGPIGIAAAALTGLATLIFFHFDKAVEVITKLTNWFIALYNEVLPLRIATEAIVLVFKTLFDVARGGIEVFKTLFTTLRDSFKALISFDFDAVGEAFKKGFSEIAKVGSGVGEDFADNLSKGIKNTLKGREFVTESDVEGAIGGIKRVGDKIADFFTPDPGQLAGAIREAVDETVILLEEDPLVIPTILEDPLEDYVPDFDLPEIAAEDIIDEQSFDRSFAKLASSLKENLPRAFSEGLADGIFAAFDAVDTTKIAELNDEIKENQALLSDKSASREERDAARERIALINDEIAAEKAKGDVVTQVTATVIDAAEQAIKAALARALANVIAGEATKGLFGILAAGAAIIAVKSLFKSSVPKLAGGGILTGPSLVEAGEYPGAGINPEVIAPLDKLTGMIRKAMPDVHGRAMQPVVIGGTVTNMIRGSDVYQVIKLQHENEKRRTNINPFL